MGWRPGELYCNYPLLRGLGEMALPALRVQALLTSVMTYALTCQLFAGCVSMVGAQDKSGVQSEWAPLSADLEGGRRREGGKDERDLVHIMGEGVPGWGSGGNNGTMTGIHGTFPRNSGNVILA